MRRYEEKRWRVAWRVDWTSLQSNDQTCQQSLSCIVEGLEREWERYVWTSRKGSSG